MKGDADNIARCQMKGHGGGGRGAGMGPDPTSLAGAAGPAASPNLTPALTAVELLSRQKLSTLCLTSRRIKYTQAGSYLDVSSTLSLENPLLRVERERGNLFREVSYELASCTSWQLGK